MSQRPEDQKIPKSPEKRKRRRILRWLLVPAGLVILALAGIRLSLPVLVQRGAEHAARHYLGLPMHIGAVDFSLRTGEVRFDDVRIGAHPDGTILPKTGGVPGETLVQVPGIVLRWSWRDLLQRRITVTSLSVDGPVLHLAREKDGKIDPLRHTAPRAAAAAPETAPPSKSEPWPIRVQSFALRSPKVMIADANGGKNLLEFSMESFELDEISVQGNEIGLGALTINGPELKVRRELVLSEAKAAAPLAAAKPPSPSPAKSGWHIRQVDIHRAKFTWEGREGPLDVQLTLKIAGFTAEAKKHFPVEMTMQVGTGKMSVKGEAGMVPPFFQGRAKWDDLSFPPLLLAVRPDLMEWLQSANSSGNLEVLLDAAGTKGPPGFQVSGHTALENLAAAAPGDNRVTLGCKRLDLTINKLIVPLTVAGKPPRPYVADFASIQVDDPWLVYTHPASFLSLLGGSDEPFLTDITISRLDLAGGDIKLNDTSMASTSSISALAVTLRDLQYPASTFSQLSLAATLPTTSQFSLEGSLAPGGIGDFVIALQDLDLPPWSPYAKSYGVSLDRGTASLQTKLKINGTAVQADNEVVLNRFGLSLLNPTSFAKEFGLPVDLALGLLRDPAGNIRLTIPVRMDETGTTVSKNEVLGSALKAAFVGALSSPLKLLGAGFGTDKAAGTRSRVSPTTGPLEVPPIKTLPGSVEPVAGISPRIKAIGRLLAERPEIAFDLRGRIGPGDLPILAEQILLEQAKAGEKLPDIPDAGFLARRKIGLYLDRRLKGEAVSLEGKDLTLFARFVSAIEVPQTRLDVLAGERAETVRKLLIAKGANPDQLRIGKREADGEPSVVVAFHIPEPPGEKPVKPKTRRKSP